jgi:hypothetical protein
MKDSEKAEEIEVTPEMIEAGEMVLRESGVIERWFIGAESSLAAEVFRAMHQRLSNEER